MTPIRSYASIKKNFSSHVTDIANLFREKTRDIPDQLRVFLERTKRVEETVLRQTGIKLEGLKILEIGTGQLPLRLKYFSAKNEVTGIDADPVPQGFDFGAYGRLLRSGDGLRLVKTIGRKIIGVDRLSRVELEKQTGRKFSKKLKIIQADAERLPFPDGSFDFIYSFSVFEHLKNPAACLKEINRVLKLGGGFYIAVHLYASDNGCHDPRIFSGNRKDIPWWAHLRPEHAQKVRPNAFLNKIRLDEWEKIFSGECPGVFFEYLQYNREFFAGKLKEIRKNGELAGYTDDELLTVDLAVIFRKGNPRPQAPCSG